MPSHDRDADLYASRLRPLFLSLYIASKLCRHAQRARSEPLPNQAHSFGSVPRECPFASWLQTDDLTIEFFSSCGASSQTGGKP
jgi:hypothetical protein